MPIAPLFCCRLEKDLATYLTVKNSTKLIFECTRERDKIPKRCMFNNLNIFTWILWFMCEHKKENSSGKAKRIFNAKNCEENTIDRILNFKQSTTKQNRIAHAVFKRYRKQSKLYVTQFKYSEWSSKMSSPNWRMWILFYVTQNCLHSVRSHGI